MPHWKAVSAGVFALPVFVGAMLFTSPPTVFLGGFVSGVVAAHLAGPGIRNGVVHGLFTGVAVTLLGWLSLAAVLSTYEPAHVAPGFGMSILFLAVMLAVVGVECFLAATAYGLVTRAVN